MKESSEPLGTGYVVYEEGQRITSVLALRVAVALRNVDPYHRRIHWCQTGESDSMNGQAENTHGSS